MKNLTGSEPDATEVLVSPVSSMEIYPNPSGGILNINGIQTKQATVSIRIMNMVGQIVWSQARPSSPQMEIDLSKLPGGNYFIQINDGSAVTQKSFVIAR